jgi:ribose transport system permease protein
MAIREEVPAPVEPLAERARRTFGSLRSTSWIIVWLAILALWVISRFAVGPSFASLSNFWTIVVLGSFVAVAGAGEGLVILTGGIDLSIPSVITLAGVLVTAWTNGESGALVWAVPALLAVGAGIGAINGLGVVLLGISPVVFTIAMNVIVEGAVLVVTGGTPKGFAPSPLQHIMQDSVIGIPIVVLLLLGFAIVVGVIMSNTTFGRRVYAVGNSQQVAKLSGVTVPLTIVGVYAVSGFTAILTGIMLTGYSAQSFLGMGNPYLLPSIAAVVIGGASILGGRGHYIGTLGGAIFLSLLTSFLGAFSISDAEREIIFGCVILLAVIAARERINV